MYPTGKELINPALEELHTNVRIIKQRPNLFSVIPNIIYGIESKKGLPEEYLKMENPKMSAIKAELAEMASKSDQPPRAKLRSLHSLAKKHGYSFTELCRQMETTPTSHLSIGEQQSGSNVAGSSGQKASNAEQRSGMSVRLLPGTAPFAEPIPEDVQSGDAEAGGNATVGWRKMPEQVSPEELVERIRSVSTFSNKEPPALPTRTPSVYSRIFGEANVTSDREVQRHVLGLDRGVINTWGIMYCGGSKPVQDALTSISSKYHINLNCESFAW